MKNDNDTECTKRIPSRVVKSRKPSPVAKSGISSTYEDATVDEHVENLRNFFKSNILEIPELIDR